MADKPTQSKVAQQAGGIGIGAAIAIVVAWAFSTQGVDVPQEVSAAFGAIFGAVVQELSGVIGAWRGNS